MRLEVSKRWLPIRQVPKCHSLIVGKLRAGTPLGANEKPKAIQIRYVGQKWCSLGEQLVVFRLRITRGGKTVTYLGERVASYEATYLALAKRTSDA